MFRVYKCSIANFAVVGSFSGMDASDMILQQSSSFEALWKIAVVNCLEEKLQMNGLPCHIRHIWIFFLEGGQLDGVNLDSIFEQT